VATRPEAGRSLFTDAQRRHGGKRVYIDVPLPNVPAVQAVEDLGLSVQRHLLRMNRGQTVRERVELIWASSGPEKG
jgi:hypothetical protein